MIHEEIVKRSRLEEEKGAVIDVDNSGFGGNENCIVEAEKNAEDVLELHNTKWKGRLVCWEEEELSA